MESSEQKIIDAAIRLFAKKGFTATSIRDIANESGLASSALYYYVNNKNKLLRMIMEKYLQQIIDVANERISTCTTPSQKLQELVHLHVELHGKERFVALVVDTEYRSLEGEDRERIRALRKEYEAYWHNVLQEGVKDSSFQIQEVKLATYALLEMCTGVVHWFTPNKEQSIEQVGNRFAEMALNLVRYTPKKTDM